MCVCVCARCTWCKSKVEGNKRRSKTTKKATKSTTEKVKRNLKISWTMKWKANKNFRNFRFCVSLVARSRTLTSHLVHIGYTIFVYVNIHTIVGMRWIFKRLDGFSCFKRVGIWRKCQNLKLCVCLARAHNLAANLTHSLIRIGGVLFLLTPFHSLAITAKMQLKSS